jgi:RimJ/RimL family protein N-acetyltransferase
MTDAIHIREITEHDIAAFRATVDAVARERLYLSRLEGPSLEGATNFVRANLAQANPHFVAVAADTLIGWCDIVRSNGDCERHIGRMGMGLLPPWRGKGIGRKLLAAALQSADLAQLTRIELSVHGSNERAIKLYHSLGFQDEGRLRHARHIDGRYEDILLMARLDPSHAR